jgi:rhomboid protease GluP
MTSQPPPLPEQQAARNPNPIPVLFKISKEKPWVTYVLMGLTVAVYGLQMVFTYFSAGHYDWPKLLGAKINDLILAGQLWRLITPVLLHGSLLHIALNMYALFILGPGLERFYGHRRFLVLYLACGYTGNVLSFLLSANASIGASTAIFGLVAAQVIFIVRNKLLFGKRAGPLLMNMGMVVAVNLGLGLMPGIDNWGHLGGLMGGLLFAWFGGPRYQIQPGEMGPEMKEINGKFQTLWGFLWSAGLFTAIVIGKFLIK